MHVLTFTKEELEEIFDKVKAVILADLVRDGYMEMDEAESYATTTTVILKKKGFFRTVTNKWDKTTYDNGYRILVVGNSRLGPEQPPSTKGKLISILSKRQRKDEEDKPNDSDTSVSSE